MDVVVTIPQMFWREWLSEGDLASVDRPSDWGGVNEYFYYLGGRGRPKIEPNERVYVVALGRLRGYAPLVRYEAETRSLVRHGGAVAVTIDEAIPGFRGYRYRWWPRELERPFAEWM